MRMEAGAEGTKAVKSIRKVKWGEVDGKEIDLSPPRFPIKGA